jgi:1-acyl-sn-glycerol-3-phosphate acyltransferase
VLKKLIKLLSILILKILGWKVDSGKDIPSKFLLITYPHTSNWDFIFSLLIQWVIGLKIFWVAKHSLFKGPMKYMMTYLNAIPVNRTFPKNFITEMVSKFDSGNNVIIAIAPEGTRKKTKYLKTGFYEIAIKAKVPLVLGYLDYKNKIGGFGTCLQVSGDIQKDLNRLKEFYADKTAFDPEKTTPIEIKI